MADSVGPRLARAHVRAPGALLFRLGIPTALPPLRRVFFLDQTRNFLIQVQPSRFLSNWRRIQDNDVYPRFDRIFDAFKANWRRFLAFLQASRVEAPAVNQYELTYIDHVLEGDVTLPAGIEESIPVFAWSKARSTNFLPAPGAVGLNMQFALPSAKGVLHVTINHGQRSTDRKNVLVMNLTARGPGRPDAGDLDEWFAVAHEWTVKGFRDLTSLTAHAKWGVRQ